jgi:enterochelin esterase-like enzyme/acetyl esterase/lipase
LAADTENTLSESEMASAPTANVVNIKEENAIPLAAPRELRTIPEAYYSPAAQQGKLAELTYDTYESKTYEQNAKTLHKRAIVYLPYGYSDSSEYNVFYLMHGGWGNESSTLGTPNQPNQLKNVIDNAIVKGDMKPLIIVCPTYNNESPRDSADFSLALELNRNFHNELVNDLMPAVESTYNTYAKGVTPEELMVSRDHRGFGGFSMGSVATWRTFQNCLDYFRFYLPMSCGTSLGDENIFEAAKNRDPDDYFVWVSTGTKDFAYSYDERRVEKMRESAYFMESTDSATGNFLYLVKEGYSHDGLAAMEYTYNGLCWFWNTDSAIGDLANLSTYTVDTKLSEVTTDKAFGDYGRLIFPVNESYYSGDTLGTLRLTWYNNINPETTVEVANYFKNHAEAGKTIFFDIYTDEEKAKDPAKKDTGLFFFKGGPGEKFAVCNAGGGFAYVGAMHDSFPLALELSKKGYNAFALIYRPGAQTACEDLARAISFIFEHAEELEVSTDGYSLWGGSAGARMAANLGSYGTAAFGGGDWSRPATVVMQYTGHTDYTKNDPPTFAVVGESDGIASWRTMEQRISNLKTIGIDAEFRHYPGLGHGFGLGMETVAEGWVDEAVEFWEEHS